MKKISWFLILFFSSFSLIIAFASSGETGAIVSESVVQKMALVNVTDIEAYSVNVEWEELDWYNWYVVYYDTKSSVDNYKFHSAVLTWTWTNLKNLTPNTDYYLVIKAFDNHVNEILVSEEIKFTTADWTPVTYWASDLMKDWDSSQNSATVYSSSSVADNNIQKIANDNPANGRNYLDWSNSDSVISGTEQIKKLPRTWPASYIIVALSLIISFALINLSKTGFNLKK